MKLFPRILDGGPATLDALGEVVAALNGTQLEVYLDGGVRTGMDVVKAMILGRILHVCKLKLTIPF